MEANEAMRRIFWRHRWLLIAMLLLPVAAIAPLRLHQPVTYAATASIQAQSAEPDAETQVTAILSRVSAVATSPSVVQSAISAARVHRSALSVAKHEVSAASLGSSAIVNIAVTDPSKAVAISLARALATAVVKVLNALGSQSSLQLAALTRERNLLQANRADLVKQLAAAENANKSATSASVAGPIAQLQSVEAELTSNSNSLQQVLSNSTIGSGAGLISPPSSATGVTRHVASYTALAGLLGLVVGLLIATIHELARPTLAEPAAGARELSLVFLGDAELAGEEGVALDDELTTRLALAADRLGAQTLVLTGQLPPAQLTALAADIDRHLPVIVESVNGDGSAYAGNRVSNITALSAHLPPAAGGVRNPAASFTGIAASPLRNGSARSARLTVVALPDLTLQARPEEPALVLVLTRFAPRGALDRAVDLGVTTGWPLLGVIGLQQRRRRRRRAAEPRPPAAGQENAVPERKPLGQAAKHLGAAL